MNLARICKQQGMTIQEYHSYKKQLQEKAENIYEKMALDHKEGTGLYFSLSDYIDIDSQESQIIIDFLNELDGIEIFHRTLEFRLI